MKPTLILCLVAFLCTTGWSQKKVVVRGILIRNDYQEYSVDQFSDPKFTASFFTAFENSLRQKLGDIEILYPGGKKINFIDVRGASSYREAVGPSQEYARQYFQAKETDHDYLVDVRSRISDTFKGSRNNIQFISRVVLKDARGKSIVRRSGKVNLTIPPPDFNPDNILINDVDILQAFPIQAGELQEAFTRSTQLAFMPENKETITANARPKNDQYDSFTKSAIPYRLLVKNNFTRTPFKMKLFGFYTLSQRKPILLSRLSDNKPGVLNFGEAKITDINFGAGIEGLGLKRSQRNFRIGLNAPNIPEEQYLVKGVFYTNSIVNKKEVTLFVRTKEITGSDKLKFQSRYASSDNNNLNSHNRELGRVFSPFAKLEGQFRGKHLEVQSSSTCINALEVLIDGKLAAVIAHPLAPRKYLRKNKKMLPFMVYISPELSQEEESIALQAFQLNRIGYILGDHKDQTLN